MDQFRDFLITDRTAADVERAQYLAGLWGPAPGQWRGTAVELAEWEAGLKGAYNAADLNRVTLAASYVLTKLGELGYAIPKDTFPAYMVSVAGAGTGGGLFYKGDQIVVNAEPLSGYEFLGWEENGETVSTNLSYSFTVEKSRVLSPVYKAWVLYIPVGSSAYVDADGKEYYCARLTNG